MRRYISPASFKSVTILLAGMFLLGTVVAIWQYTLTLPQPGDRLVQGRIVSLRVEKTTSNNSDSSRSRVSYRTFLTIKIVNTNTIVTTVLSGDWTNQLPDVVTFYYSGDPGKRVYLQEDKSAITGVILFSLMALTVIVGLVGVLMFYQWDARIRHNQRQALLDSISKFESRNPNHK